MYFYVMESPSSQRFRKVEEQILTTLRGYGISGEVVLANPARPAFELAKSGIAKGYDTIVAIGGDKTINGVAMAVQGTRAVMGIVPLDAHPRITALIGTDSPAIACESLRYRTVQLVDITFINPGKYFLTEARIDSNTELPVRVHVDDVVMETKVTRLSIFGDGTVELANSLLGRSPIRQTIEGLFGRHQPVVNTTHLKGQYIKVETSRSLPVRSESDTVGRTPFVAAVKPNALKLIVKRAIVPVVNS